MSGGFRRAPGAPPLVYGHRGVRGMAPENTMAAFALAAEQDADGIELDVRLAASGEVVVAHDPTLARVTGGTDARNVADLDYVDLARVDVGAGERIPRLTEVLTFARARRLLVNVELKSDVPNRLALVRATARILRGFPDAPRWILVSSFDPAMLAAFGLFLPQIPRAFLFEEDAHRWLRSAWTTLPLRAAAIHPPRTRANPATIRGYRARGLFVNVWTVNDPEEARDLGELGVDGIITDVPDVVGAAVRG